MAVTVKCACGKELQYPESFAGKRGKCPTCGAIIPLPSPSLASETPPESGSIQTSGPVQRAGAPSAGDSAAKAHTRAEALAALLNQVKRGGAEALADSLNAPQASGRPEPAPVNDATTEHFMPVGSLGCLFPVAILLLTLAILDLFIRPNPENASFYAVQAGLASVGLALLGTVAWRLKANWTRARVIWCVCVAMFWAAIGSVAAIGTRAEQQVQQRFAPALADFSDGMAPQWGAKPTGAKKVLPITINVRNSKGNATQDRNPQVDTEVYGALPGEIRPDHPNDVGVIALVTWDWLVAGQYHNQGTGTANSTAYVGMCQITLVDRLAKRTFASDTLKSQERPPEGRVLRNDWYGSQPSAKEVAEHIQEMMGK